MNRFLYSNFGLIVLAILYFALFLASLSNSYFWDNNYYSSVFGHLFSFNLFDEGFLPDRFSLDDSLFKSMGIIPPTMGFLTAILWKLFGHQLWVSHAFVFLCSLGLIFNTWKLIQRYFPKNIQNWVLIILFLEPTVLSQMSIASPDLILLLGLVICIRGVVENRRLLLLFGLIVISLIHSRGVVAVPAIFAFDVFTRRINYSSKSRFLRSSLVYLAALSPFISYVTIYSLFFGLNLNPTSSEHYFSPDSLSQIIHHLGGFVIRSVENGRGFLWILGLLVAYNVLKKRFVITPQALGLFLLFGVLIFPYLIFVFTTCMPFASRYFMPHYFIFSFFLLYVLLPYLSKKSKIILISVVLLFEVTGNFWIYPKQVSVSWDGTLAHLPFYRLKDDCLEYIQNNNIDFDKVSGGFCFAGDQRLRDLKPELRRIDERVDNDYFIYSNISNLDDDFLVELENPKVWTPIKHFSRGFIEITLYKHK